MSFVTLLNGRGLTLADEILDASSSLPICPDNASQVGSLVADSARNRQRTNQKAVELNRQLAPIGNQGYHDNSWIRSPTSM